MLFNNQQYNNQSTDERLAFLPILFIFSEPCVNILDSYFPILSPILCFFITESIDSQ